MIEFNCVAIWEKHVKDLLETDNCSLVFGGGSKGAWSFNEKLDYCRKMLLTCIEIEKLEKDVQD